MHPVIYRRFLVWFVAGMAIVGLVAPLPAAEKISVGVAAVDITPDFPVRLNGFAGRLDESKGVRQHIFAKALVIGADDPVVVFAVDTLGIPDEITQVVAASLAESHGVKADHVAITATHTHSAPMVKNVAPTIFGQTIPPKHQEHIDRYTAELVAKLKSVGAQALDNRSPAELSWGVGTVDFAVNRRTNGGPVDHDLPVLVARGDDGKPFAIWVNYACHAVTLNDYQIDGDWPGYAQTMIENLYPGATALVSIGCGADANPSSGVTGSRDDIAAAQGVQIADEVKRLLSGPLTPLAAVPTVESERIILPLAPLPTCEQWEERAKDGSYVGYHARVQLARLDRGEELMTEISYPIQSWQFGDELAVVFLPGEVVVDYAKRLKSELDGRRVWVNAYANHCPGYVPSERILNEGGYEAGGAMTFYDIPSPYATGVEQKIFDVVLGQLDDAFSAKVETSKTQGVAPLPPLQSLSAMRTHDDLKIELVAAEPLVSSPVAIEWGPDGRLWVAEMFDYPAGIDGNYGPGGRIKVLEDTDGDGQYDRGEVFLEGIPFPTGVTVWRNGVLVCAAPDILYAEDTDGDNKADKVVKLFSGFGTGNYQARVNSLEYGLDGWVYGSCGLFGGTITNFKGTEPLALGDRDFRIKPDTGEIEPVIGRTQQGRVRDDWGNWFGCDNGTLIRHYPLEDRYLRRNPHVVPPATSVYVPSYPDSNRLFPIAQPVLFKLSGPPGRATSACGLGIYRDDLVANRGNSFTCEPVNNLVHRLHVVPDGVTFNGSRDRNEQQSEFLTSTDVWFRPVQARTGPDGGLWIVDMYRYVIEHPRWIPTESLAELDVRAGANFGRIYRIVPRDAEPRARVRLDEMSPEELVQAIDSPNGWQRDMASRLLVWNDLRRAGSKLAQLAKSSSRPEARLTAYVTLFDLQMVTADHIGAALKDNHAAVRRHAIRMAESLLETSPGLAENVLELSNDDDPQVQLQLAFTLGEIDPAVSADVIAQQASRNSANAYVRAALLSSVHRENIVGLLENVAAIVGKNREMTLFLHDLLLQAVALGVEEGVRDGVDQLVGQAIDAGSDDPNGLRNIGELLTRLMARGAELDKLLPKSTRTSLQSAWSSFRDVAADPDAGESERVAALSVLGTLPSEKESDVEILLELLTPQTPLTIQLAALDACARCQTADLAGRLLAEWDAQSPAVRSKVLDILASRENWLEDLLSAVEEGTILPSHIDLPHQQQLLQHPNEAIRQRVGNLFTAMSSSARKDIVQTYLDERHETGDVEAGRQLFRKHCSACHRLEDFGNAVGPDLAPYSLKPLEALAHAVFDPNQAVDPRYLAYVAVLADGRLTTGLLKNETANSLGLVNKEGKEEVLLRTDIDELRNTGKSLMPEGFEKEFTPETFDHLWAFIKSQSRPYKDLAGNTPEVIAAPQDAAFDLPATNAQIFGDAITFEQPLQNIGYWHGKDDLVMWNFELPAGGHFEVDLEFACDSRSAGNPFIVEIDQLQLTGRVPSTGGWSHYRSEYLGQVSLPAGSHRLMIRPVDQPNGALMDLKHVRFRPAEPSEKTSVAFADTDVVLVNNPEDLAAGELAPLLLDDNRTTAEREALVKIAVKQAGPVIAAMTGGLDPGTKEEYRRIPWIWRVAIAAGRENNDKAIVDVIGVSLPQRDQPLFDWQAVVIGGGIVNGISQQNVWPAERIAELLADKPDLQKRWDRMLALSINMADDESVPTGTRYDALRNIGTMPWESSGEQLTKYLAEGVNGELQMGAVSGLSDVNDKRVIQPLLKSLSYLSDYNRDLALAALIRTSERRTALGKAVESKAVPKKWLKPEHIDAIAEQK